MPDPKLKAAMEEIKPILAKYDIAAIVLLASASHIEYLRELKATWTCIYIEPGGIRVRAKQKDFPSKEAFQRAMTDTIGCIAGFADALRNESEQMIRVLKVLGEAGVEFSHSTREEPPNG